MQQKFKVGDKVKVLTRAYPFAYSAEGVVTKIGPGDVYIVDRNAINYPSDQYGCFDHDSWRYCFYEEELELVEDKPKTKFKAGDKVRCVDNTGIQGNRKSLDMGEIYTVGDSKASFVYLNSAWYADTRFELATDQEVSNVEPSVQITVNVDENICAAFNEVKNGLEILLSGNTEPDYVIGQEVYVSNDFNRYLRKGVLLDAIPRNGLMHVNIGGFDCFVEEERVYTREGTKGE